VPKDSSREAKYQRSLDSARGTGGVRGEGPVIDILCNAQTNRKARPLMEALQRGGVANGFDARLVDHHEIGQGWLFVYGLGGLDRVQYAQRERLIAFDLAYWDRKGAERKYRVAIGGFHSPKRIFQGKRPPASRWEQSGLTITEHGGNPDGPVLLVGNGPKSTAVGASGWTAAKSIELRKAFPGVPIWYRPKPGRPAESGVVYDLLSTEEPIDSVLTKVSLVVCRHSNVAVDACRLGVPAVCDDGAAAAIYPKHWSGEQPGLAKRTEFLHRLAWWQWSIAECETGQFWSWAKEQMCA
jgi:hypothetical protein